MKHNIKTLFFLCIALLTTFCNCNQEPLPQTICNYSHEVQLQNYVWDIQVDSESLKDNPDFSFPYSTFNTVDLEIDLNAWLNGDGIAAVTMSNPEREFMIAVEQTGKVFQVVAFSGDQGGGNQVEVNFNENC